MKKKNKAQTYDYEYRYNKAYLQFFSDPGLGTVSAQGWTRPTRGHVNLDKIILNVIFDDIESSELYTKATGLIKIGTGLIQELHQNIK